MTRTRTRMAKAMLELGISGIKLARTLEVAESQVSKWRNGLMYVSPRYRSKLSEILGVPAEELFDERGIPK